MKLHVIGCSGSFAGPHSPASSYLLEHEDESGRCWRILLDIGSGAFGTLQGVLDPADLDAVLISHLHPDHFLDITGLEVFRAYHERTDLPVLPIWAPANLDERLCAVMGRESTIPDGVNACPFDYRAIRDGEPFEIGPLRFEPHLVRHPVEAYGFRITDGSSVFAYSGDTDACDALDELARGADLFLCEAGYIEGRDDRFEGIHLTGKRAGESAAAAGVRHLALTHIPAWTDPAIPLAEARGVFDGPITMVRGLDVLEVDPAPSTSGSEGPTS